MRRAHVILVTNEYDGLRLLLMWFDVETKSLWLCLNRVDDLHICCILLEDC